MAEIFCQDSLNEMQVDVIREALEKKMNQVALAMEMGLGKTRTSVSLGFTRSPHPILAVVDKTRIPTWQEELEKAFGDKIIVFPAHKDYLKKFADWELPKGKNIVVLTTPETLSKEYKELNLEERYVHQIKPVQFGPTIVEYRDPKKPLLKQQIGGPAFMYSTYWGTLIVDEIHTYINCTTARCRAIACVASKYRIGLSGTMFDEPKLERYLGFHLILHIDGPRTLPDLQTLMKEAEFGGFAKHLIVRKSNCVDIAYKEHLLYHALSPEENKIFNIMTLLLRKLNEKVRQLKLLNDTAGVRLYSAYKLSMITYIRQSLVCPLIPITAMFIDMADYSGRSELSDILLNTMKENGLSEYIDNNKNILSSRFKEILKCVDSLPNDRMIIFSSSRLAIDLLEKRFLAPTGRPTFTIGATMSTPARQRSKNDFEATENGILLLTYDIGAEGLNLQASNKMLFVDLWWNSAKVRQAIKRIYRPGQLSDTVNIYFLLSNTGIEEQILLKNQLKDEIIEELMTKNSTKKFPKMTIDDIVKILTEDTNKNKFLDMRRVF